MEWVINRIKRMQSIWLEGIVLLKQHRLKSDLGNTYNKLKV